MRCRVADLIVEVPEADGLAVRCQEYVWNKEDGADLMICTEFYRREKYDAGFSEEVIAYIESAYQFYKALVDFDGLFLHASAVALNGKAYLFSGPCGMGKSTHTRLWQKLFGDDACVINDDKPALRRMDGKWYAYGTPWCGKDGINANRKVPLAGICFLKQAPENKIRPLDSFEAMQKILGQTIYKFENAEKLDKMLKSLNLLLAEVPVYELENVPEISAVQLSYKTMYNGAQEAGL